MGDIHKVVVIGAGAMGAYFASRFYEAPGFSTSFLAKGERQEKLQKNGLVINGDSYHIPAVDPQQIDSPADLVIVALKHHHLADTIPDMKNLIGPDTTIISVMNGLESEEMIGAVYGMDKILYTISVGIDAVREGSRINYTKPGTHYFGEAKNPSITPKVRRVQAAFDQAGIKWETPPDMVRMLWWKFMINVGMNQASAVTGAPYGIFHTDPDAQGLMEALMQEVITLAGASNVNLTDQDIHDWYKFLNMLSPQGKTSMLQDVEAKRKTEIEIFGGKVVRLGKALGIPTPVNLTVSRIILLLEQQYLSD